MKHMLTIICLSLFSILGQAQQKEINLDKQLFVQDQTPPLPWFSALFTEDEKLHLDTDKLILLDFFDTYCSACIASLPKLQKLQNGYGEQMQLVMVTYQDSSTIGKFWEKNPTVVSNHISLPIIYGDTLLRQYFPHRFIPHVAWIYKGQVVAVTHSDFVNKENVAKLLEDGKIELPFKNDFGKVGDREERLAGQVIGYVRMTGFQEAVPIQSYKYEKDSVSGKYKTSFVNMPILGAYTSVLSRIRKPEFLLKKERIVWKVRDSTVYDYFDEGSGSNVWLSKHGIAYERWDRVERPAAEQAKLVLQDLNGLLGLHVYWSKHHMKALVIKGEFKGSERQSNEDSQEIEGTGVLAFLMDLSDQYDKPIVDKVNTLGKIALPNYQTLEELNTVLAEYGIEIVEEEEWVDVLVIEEQ